MYYEPGEHFQILHYVLSLFVRTSVPNDVWDFNSGKQ